MCGRRGAPVRDGPPPHSRGSPLQVGEGVHGRRTTPAFAGITRPRTPTAETETDHPRIRGDHKGATGFFVERPGPPPHSRGSHRRYGARPVLLRTTPAFAGITPASPRAPGWAPDHPRIRGDHFPDAPFRRVYVGPPPHSRGSLPGTRGSRGHPGTTPAFAGITWPRGPRTASTPDHPRIRGDHYRYTSRVRVDTGPPPHSRGSHVAPDVVAVVAGTTPAFAGITDRAPEVGVVVGDHPRIRGDHTDGRSPRGCAPGPPPHSRGSLRGARRRPGARGTTPAFAGIT